MFVFGPKIKSLIQKACANKKHIKLTVGVIANGEKNITVFDESGVVQNDNFVYEIGSITKTFTTSLLAKYRNEQKMSLEDSIQKYVAGLNDDQYYPTLKRLATHTSGYHRFLPNGKWFRFTLLKGLITGDIKEGENLLQMDYGKMVQLLCENPLQDKDYPWQYANFGMALVGYAVGACSGLGYSETMNRFLSEELGLKHSYTGTNPDKNLHGFHFSNEDIGNWVWDKDNNLMAPAGDISSTAEDLLAYARMNMFEEKPYFALCHQKYADAKKYDMGLGWILQKNKHHVLFHNGATGGFRTYLGIDKQKKCAVVVLANYPINTDKIGQSLLDSL